MTVKASVSISKQQEAFARALVEEGRFSSLSAVVQRGLDLLREETALKEAELAALRALVEERRSGVFLKAEEAKQQTEDMVAAKKKRYGL